MKRLLAHKWVRVVLGHVFGLGTVVLIISSASLLLGSACPTYWMLGICCPFCGMTRAHLAAMRLDFAAAFYYHPVFFTGVPMIWLLAHKRLLKKKWTRMLWWVLVISMGVLLGVTYVYRVFTFGFDFFA